MYENKWKVDFNMVFLMVHFLAANVCLLRYLNPTNDNGTFVSADIFC
jgi:hypothetical protein